VGASTFSQPYGPPRPVAGMALPFLNNRGHTVSIPDNALLLRANPNHFLPSTHDTCRIIFKLVYKYYIVTMAFGLVTGFIELLQLVTTSKDYALTVLHTSQITIGHTRSSQSVRVFTIRCLLAASKGGRSLYSGFPNCSRPQLPASHSN
jgi:hypothetical protein